MNDYIAEITLDLNCERSCQTIMLTQFDKGKKIHLTVTANGAPYSVSGCSVVMKGVNSDGSRVAVDCDIEQDGTATAVTDDITFAYVKGREYAPVGEEWERAVAYWKTLRSDDDAVFDKEVAFDASDIIPYVSYGTNPGMAIGITECVPRLEEIEEKARPSFLKALDYMGMNPGDPLVGLRIDYVFLGACTNGRIEDFRAFASAVKGHKKADRVTALLVPGSWAVARQIHEEGIDRILEEAGFEIRQPGCSACLAMNDDKIPPGKYCVSTSNRNFEGRQGPGSRTILASPLTAAAAAIHGVVCDPRDVI